MPTLDEGKVRLNLVVSIDVRNRIDRIRHKTEHPTTTEVVRRALKLYEQLTNVAGSDGKLTVVTSDGTQQTLVMM